MSLEKILAPHDCQLALQLCQRAMELRTQKFFQESAEICSFVSTLCMKNVHDSCKRESSLCALSGKHSMMEDYPEAKKACDEARGICPRNYVIMGS